MEIVLRGWRRFFAPPIIYLLFRIYVRYFFIAHQKFFFYNTGPDNLRLESDVLDNRGLFSRNVCLLWWLSRSFLAVISNHLPLFSRIATQRHENTDPPPACELAVYHSFIGCPINRKHVFNYSA